MNTPTLSLQRADCGCIGFRTSEWFMLVLQPCDGEQDLCFGLREMKDKTFTPVPADAAREIVAGIQRLIMDGYAMRRVRAELAR